MKAENHHDPIQDLAKRLREQTVPYREGAWEQFEAKVQKKKKTLVLWPYFSVAAVLLIAITLFWKPEQKQILSPEVAEQTINKNLNDRVDFPIEGKELSAKGNVRPITGENRKAFVKKDNRAEEKRELLAFEIERNTNVLVEENAQQLEAVSIVSVKRGEVFAFEEREKKNAVSSTETRQQALTPEIKEKQVPPIIDKEHPRDLLAELLKIEANEYLASEGKDKKWSFGVDLAPNISGNSQVNMGGGIALSYAVSPKVSISSGISYLQVGAERGLSYPGGAHSALDSPPVDGKVALVGNEKVKTLNRSNTSLGGLDIPFNINYQFSKKVYASAGFSIFNVLHERNLDLYHNREVNVAYVGSTHSKPEPVIRTFYSQETSAEKLYEGELNGFFNLSIGYAVPLSKKVGISLEPFLKIPMGSMKENEFNLSNGGLKISTRF